MILDERMVESIVSGVLEQLRERSRGEAVAMTSAVVPNTATSVIASSTALLPPVASKRIEGKQGDGTRTGRLVLAEKVITADVLAAKWSGETQAVVKPKAVVTPSGLDFFRTRKISWSRAAEGVSGGSETSSRGRWLIVLQHATAGVQGGIEDLKRSGELSFATTTVGLPNEAGTAAIGAICRGEASGVLVVTREPELVTCLANRNSKVRAAAVETLRRVETLTANLGANVFCVDPAARGRFELRNLMRGIMKLSPVTPAGWNG